MKLAAWIAKNSSVPRFAEAIGASQSTVYAWLSMPRVPRRDALARIMEVTDGAVGPSDFFDVGDVHAPSPTPKRGHVSRHRRVKCPSNKVEAPQ